MQSSHSNPYISPRADDTSPRAAARPIGVSIISILLLTLGAGMGSWMLLFVLHVVRRVIRVGFETTAAGLGIQWVGNVFIGPLLSGLFIWTGVGMWRGWRSAWWLSAYFLISPVATLVRNTLFLSRPVSTHNGIATAVAGMVFAYLLKRNVSQFFGIRSKKKLIAAPVLLAIWVVVATAVTAIGAMLKSWGIPE